MLGRILLALWLALGGVYFLPQSQAQAGTPDDVYTIERYYTENVTEQTTTSTTFVDALTLTFTPPATANYTVITSALTNNSDTNYATVVQLVIDGTNYSETYHKPVDASLNWRSFGAHKVISLTGGITHTIKVTYRTENAAGTASIMRVAIAVLEVATYYNAESNSENTTTSTSYVDAVTLTFTPTAGNYLILLTANVVSGTSGKSAFVQWTIDGTPDSEFEQPGTNYMSWGAIETENLTAAPHTIKIQYHTQNPATAYIKSARITAILLTDLGATQYAESEAESKTTSITYVDKTTLTFTPPTRGDYLVIASGLGRQENASYAFLANLDVDGTSSGEYIFVPGSMKHYRSFMMLSTENFSAAQHNIKIQWRTNNAASNSEAFIKNANIIAIQMDTAESYNDSGHTTVDNSFSGAEPDTYAYIWAHGLMPNHSYYVAFYDAGGVRVGDQNPTSSAYGGLSTNYDLTNDPGATGDGTWHAVIFDSEYGSPTDNYSDVAIAPGYVVEDGFYVYVAAIPEFPTIIAGIMVAGLCFGIYYWMRKRRVYGVNRVC